MTLWIWLVVGAGIGYLASTRRTLSAAKCVVIGTLLGPLAVALFFVPAGPEASLPVPCPYCSNPVIGSARLCHHCGAILS